MEFLPCGHVAHSLSDELLWVSPAFKSKIAEWTNLRETLITELKKKGRLDPGSFPHDSYRSQLIYGVKADFANLRKRLPREEYLQRVNIYDRELQDFLARPSCQLEIPSFPLDPQGIPGVRLQSDVLPRTGGRPPDKTIQKRNKRIAELTRECKNAQICVVLDKEKWSVPLAWRQEGIATWRQAYARPAIRGNVHTLISKIATRAKRKPSHPAV
jgi:hypothetical protein